MGHRHIPLSAERAFLRSTTVCNLTDSRVICTVRIYVLREKTVQGLQKYTWSAYRGRVYVAWKLERLAHDHPECREILQLEKNTVFSLNKSSWQVISGASPTRLNAWTLYLFFRHFSPLNWSWAIQGRHWYHESVTTQKAAARILAIKDLNHSSVPTNEVAEIWQTEDLSWNNSPRLPGLLLPCQIPSITATLSQEGKTSRVYWQLLFTG